MPLLAQDRKASFILSKRFLESLRLNLLKSPLGRSKKKVVPELAGPLRCLVVVSQQCSGQWGQLLSLPILCTLRLGFWGSVEPPDYTLQALPYPAFPPATFRPPVFSHYPKQSISIQKWLTQNLPWTFHCKSYVRKIQRTTDSYTWQWLLKSYHFRRASFRHRAMHWSS